MLEPPLVYTTSDPTLEAAVTMKWPEWLPSFPTTARDDHSSEAARLAEPLIRKSNTSWDDNLNSIDWSHYTSPRAIIPSVLLTGATLALIRLYKTYLRRIPNVGYLKPGLFRRRSLYGYVTSVGDADNFRLFHTPGGRLAGWGWLPGRRPDQIKKLKDKTIPIRLAGIDAPELAHFGKPAQPHSQEAIEWLRGAVLHRYVRAYPYRRDQYDRVVATAFVRRWLLFKTDVGLGMLKNGLATVYEAKTGAEFGEFEEKYRAEEVNAKKKKVGMWQRPGLLSRALGKKAPEFESPRDYKTRTATSK